MDLYIRSQDKMNLVKVNDVSVNYRNNTQIIANYIPDFIGKEGEYYETLGTYKTKERALEVLDEIENKIKYMGKTYEIGTMQDERLMPHQYNYVNNVYEMPKE